MTRPRAARQAALGLVAALLVGWLVGPGPLAAASRPTSPAATPGGPEAARDSIELPGTTTRVSISDRGRPADGLSALPSISADGRFVVFVSLASRLGATPAAGPAVVLRDRVAGTTRTVYASTGGTVGTVAAPAGTRVLEATISGDGRWVAFTVELTATRVGSRFIGVWDSGTGQVAAAFTPELLKRAPVADQPSLSFDGRFLAFRTASALDSTDANELEDVYVLDRASGKATIASVASDGRPGLRGASDSPAISADGRWVAFRSAALNLAAGTNPNVTQVYLHDRDGGTTVLVSHRPNGSPGSAASEDPSVSGDGQVVAFTSRAEDLVASDANGVRDVFAWDRDADRLVLASVSTEGAPSDGTSVEGAISADGRSVAFASMASTLVPKDTNGNPATREGPQDIFVRDLVAGRTTRVSVGSRQNQSNGTSRRPAISSTGRYVAFDSSASNLVRADTNKAIDVFVRDRTPALRLADDPTNFGSVALGTPGLTRIITATSSGASAIRINGVGLVGTAAADFLVAADGCTGRLLYPGEQCQVQILFTAPAAGQRAARARFNTDAPGDRPEVRLRATVPRSSFEIDPDVGRPGTVVVAMGTGFPVNSPVDLHWSAGLTAVPLEPVIADDKGAFVAQVLVLPRDRTGRRDLIADVSLPGGTFKSPKAPFLVVEGTGTPPTSGLIQVWADGYGRPILIRR